MEQSHQILRTIYSIVKDEPEPQTYLCRPREIILRVYMDWSVVQENLKLLEQEGLVTTKQLDTLVISITSKGVDLIRQQDSKISQLG